MKIRKNVLEQGTHISHNSSERTVPTNPLITNSVQMVELGGHSNVSS